MFKLIDLPYDKEALEPVISSRTLDFHHGKHLQGYVDNLNKLIQGTQYEYMPLEEIVKASAATAPNPVFNNSGQILNHNLYFLQFSPASANKQDAENPAIKSSAPKLARQIEAQWGSIDAFKEEFTNKGATLFGSGWVWLSAKNDGSLQITQEAGANNPVTKEFRPILTFDVWEHAYYIDYQNRRPAHLQALWFVLNWEVMESRYTD